MSGMRRLALAGLARRCVAVAVAQPALGQGAGSALKGHDTDAPVDVAADRIEVQDRANRAIFSGNVDVRQGNLRLNAARITVVYANSGGGGTAIERIEATRRRHHAQPDARPRAASSRSTTSIAGW